MAAKKKKKKTKEAPQMWVRFKAFSEEGATFVIIPAKQYDLLNADEESTQEVFIFKKK